tara:strand:+ start:1335 stop:1955 length:621 start_codon:yes stop_codon:yes gene_type:complete
MQSERESLRKLTSPNSKVSCHYFIKRNGEILNLVNDKNIAWHAGKSKWGGVKNLNSNSIGIELANKGHRFGYQTFSKPQITKLTQLCKNLKKKYKIKNKFILGHSDIAPLRKIDPGEKFPWKYLSLQGVGYYPKKLLKKKNSKRNINLNFFFRNLYKIGYRYLKTKFKKKIIMNFQRKYRQNRVNGVLDLQTLEISEILAKRSNKP